MACVGTHAAGCTGQRSDEHQRVFGLGCLMYAASTSKLLSVRSLPDCAVRQLTHCSLRVQQGKPPASRHSCKRRLGGGPARSCIGVIRFLQALHVPVLQQGMQDNCLLVQGRIFLRGVQHQRRRVHAAAAVVARMSNGSGCVTHVCHFEFELPQAAACLQA